MHLLSDVITYVRRIIKSPSNALITDDLIIDYINRFYISDVDARIQVFDLKTKYQFVTSPSVDRYNMPLYSVQTSGGQGIGMYPVYQGFTSPAFINGVQVPLQTQKNFFQSWPNINQSMQAVAVGDGGSTYTLTFPFGPNSPQPQNPPFNGIIRGHVDISGIMSIIPASNIDPPLASDSSFAAMLAQIPVTSIDAAVYITSIGADGQNVVVSDSGVFLNTNVNYGLLIKPGPAPYGNTILSGGYNPTFNITGATAANPSVLSIVSNFVVGQSITITGVLGMTELNGNTYEITAVSPTTVTIDVDASGFTPYTSGGSASTLSNTINYLTGVATVTFPVAIPAGNNINVQCSLFQGGLPRSILFYNNVLTLRNPPAMQYVVELDAYLTPSAFLTTSDSIPFGYMAEYIARGAARKILSDTGDVEQFQFYEPLFKEQELLVWKRSQRQWTLNRTETIYSQGHNNGSFGNNYNGVN